MTVTGTLVLDLRCSSGSSFLFLFFCFLNCMVRVKNKNKDIHWKGAMVSLGIQALRCMSETNRYKQKGSGETKEVCSLLYLSSSLSLFLLPSPLTSCHHPHIDSLPFTLFCISALLSFPDVNCFYLFIFCLFVCMAKYGQEQLLDLPMHWLHYLKRGEVSISSQEENK